MPKSLETLKTLIQKGIYFHNLTDLISLCDKEIQSTKHQLVLFTFRGIFEDLRGYYEPPSLNEKEHTDLTEGIQEKLLEILNIMDQLPPNKIFNMLESLLKKLIINKSKLL